MRQPSCFFSSGSKGISVALGLLFLASFVQSAPADPYFGAGVQFYQKRDFKKAYSYFVSAAKSNPYDADIIYYEAMTLQQLHNNKEAIKLYASLVSNFSYSNAGKLAGAALNRLDPEYYRQLTKSKSGSATNASTTTIRPHATAGSEGQSPDYASLPSEARIPFIKEGRLLVIDASLNNRSLKMFFDTGASGCVFGKNSLTELGLSVPSGPSTGTSFGVGSSGSIETWSMPATLKVGNIERKNFEISVLGTMSMRPLLGQTFYKDYEYTIDKQSEDAGTIHFVKKQPAGAIRTAQGNSGRDLYAVPFQRAGRNLIVQVDVNGHPMAMYFDTGAANVAFTVDQLKKANISIPDDAQTTVSSGAGGDTPTQLFLVKRIKMGPIEKSDFQVSAVASAAMQYPLLGQSFFGDWQYTIDNANSVIRFVRR
jgi:clan AA aspartic protease (TIGR02281 family)